MAKAKKRTDAWDDWDDRKLGADARFVVRVPLSENARVDAALGLQMISIRLPKRLIDRLKVIAKHRGIGYQPLMRDVLSRFARGELIQVLRQQTEIAELEKDVRHLKGVLVKPGRAVSVERMNRTVRKSGVTRAAKGFVGSDKTPGDVARHTKRLLRQRP